MENNTIIYLKVEWPEGRPSKWKAELEMALQSWLHKDKAECQCLTDQKDGTVKVEISSTSAQGDLFTKETTLTLKSSNTAIVTRIVPGDRQMPETQTADVHMSDESPIQSHYIDEIPPVGSGSIDASALLRRVEQLSREVSILRKAMAGASREGEVPGPGSVRREETLDQTKPSAVQAHLKQGQKKMGIIGTGTESNIQVVKTKLIRIRDPNQGGRDITEEIMFGGSGSRNPTPPAGRPSSTPTPPQSCFLGLS
ncbi:unnamed protein product [Merluccius merluccius]